MPTEPDDTARTPDDVLAAHLAGGMSLVKAAQKSGMSERSAQRRRADPAFRARVDGLRAAIVAEAVGKLSVSMSAAAAKLAKLVRSKDDRVALTAAKEIVALGLKARRDEDMERQLADLNARLEALVTKEKRR